MTTGRNTDANAYEEARKQRLQENKRKFEDLGIKSISKSLADLSNDSNCEKKYQKQRMPKPKLDSTYILEPRRSTRARNPVSTYRDDVDIDFRPSRKRSRSYPSSWASYIARPLEEIKTASYEERACAIREAEEIQKNLTSGKPSFVKSMVRSHVYSCFWLGLPSGFCENHLPKSVVDVVLEDENGSEYDAVYIGKRAGLSGGWRGFALDHKLDDGDAVVFEQVEPTRFKVYIVRASSLTYKEKDASAAEEKSNVGSGTKTKAVSTQNTKGKGKPQKNTNGGTDDSENNSANACKTNGNTMENWANSNLRRSTRVRVAS